MRDALSDNQATPKITYIPPDQTVIQSYARRLCMEFGEQDSRYTNPEVISGFSAFLIFVSKTLAKHMSNGHKDFLLKGYTRPQKVHRGGKDVSQKEQFTCPAYHRPLLHPQIVDTR